MSSCFITGWGNEYCWPPASRSGLQHSTGLAAVAMTSLSTRWTPAHTHYYIMGRESMAREGAKHLHISSQYTWSHPEALMQTACSSGSCNSIAKANNSNCSCTAFLQLLDKNFRIPRSYQWCFQIVKIFRLIFSYIFQRYLQLYQWKSLCTQLVYYHIHTSYLFL